MSAPLWQPSPKRIESATITAFARFVSARHGIEVPDYESLWRWSIDRREDFWTAVWDFTDVRASRRWDRVLTDGDRMPGASWFDGARLNFAENLLRRRDCDVALIATSERFVRQITHAELYADVARVTNWMRAVGVGPGDRVAAYLPNIPEAIVGLLAAASLGAVFSSCSPDFGVEGAVERFGQIDPVILITGDGYQYAGKSYSILPRAVEIARRVPSIQTTLVVPILGNDESLVGLPEPIRWEAIPPTAEDITFAPLAFDHPLVILYSSGTTGRPKCIVHSAGGTLLQHLKEHRLHTDITHGDRLFYFTTTGWMMWNWLVSGLASEATLILHDGAPMYPEPSVLFDLIDEHRITIFGTSAKYLAAIQKAGLKPAHSHELTSLRTILSTGSPLAPQQFDYVYESIHPDICLSSITGGTDIVSCFALGNPTLPVWRGELQCRGLGMSVEVFDATGQRMIVGEKGELVCTRAFPSMPLYFWDDPDGQRYQEAYFARYPGVWHHGDYAELTPHGGLIIHGRSDAVLNPGGVRIGTAEIYRLVEQLPEIEEAIAVGQEWDDDVRVILFVRLRSGFDLDSTRIDQIKKHIREGATPRHVPAKVLAVPAIPRTLSGKIVELAVREVIHGRPITNEHALANPEALDHFRNRPELQN